MAHLRLFAALREAARTDKDEIDAGTVGEILAVARVRYGEEFARSLDFATVAVNGRLISTPAGEETPLAADDEVALLPPVSGGL